MACGALLAGCGGDDDPKQISGPAKDVAAAVQRFERALARQDFATVCERLFTRAAREQAGGEDCAQLLKRTGGDIRRPRIAIKSIRIKGEKATVAVDTTAVGQKKVSEQIDLIRKGRAWRVSSLAEGSD